MSATPMDPRAQLADAIARLGDEQVYGLMQLVGVDATIQGVFLEMQRRFLPDKAGDQHVVIQWDLEGPDGPTVYQMTVAPEGVTWGQGAPAEPGLVVSCSVADFMRLMIGQLDSTEAFMTGRLRVAGDLQVVQDLGTLFDMS
jgi:putative sterol carrier protein